MNKGYRTSGGTIGRIFNDKKYLLTNQVSTKVEAEFVRKQLKKMGYLVRVVKKENAEYKYHIYKRAKR